MISNTESTTKNNCRLVPAVHCQHGQLILGDHFMQEPNETEVVVEVQHVGLCRTDLYAIAGEIPTKQGGFVPGHEFSGRVISCGKRVDRYWLGKTVAVNPLIPCEMCEDCAIGQEHLCPDLKLLGVDVDGACQKQIAIDISRVYDAGDLDPKEVVFAEPLAATMGILNTDIATNQSGLIIGSGRIAILAGRLLAAKGFTKVAVADLQQAQKMRPRSFDFLIETSACSTTLQEMARLAKPRGQLVLKSRQLTPLEFDLRKMVVQQLKIQLVHYGPFDEAVNLLRQRKVRVDDLVGQVFSFQNIRAAIAIASKFEDTKVMLGGWS